MLNNWSIKGVILHAGAYPIRPWSNFIVKGYAIEYPLQQTGLGKDAYAAYQQFIKILES